MILTRTNLNLARPRAKQLLGSPQAMHAAVLAGFPPGIEPARPLWRIDTDDPVRPHLYVVSAERPDMTHVEEQAGWPSHPTTVSADYGPFLERLEAGQQWMFRLVANPSHYATLDGRQRLVAHQSTRHQVEWLRGRSESMGVDLGSEDEPTFTVVKKEWRKFRHGDKGRITFLAVTYEGVLTVKQPDALREALTSGVGRKRAYGCGLLTLARP